MCNNFNKKFIDEANKALEKNDLEETIAHSNHFMDEAVKSAIQGVESVEVIIKSLLQMTLLLTLK